MDLTFLEDDPGGGDSMFEWPDAAIQRYSGSMLDVPHCSPVSGLLCGFRQPRADLEWNTFELPGVRRFGGVSEKPAVTNFLRRSTDHRQELLSSMSNPKRKRRASAEKPPAEIAAGPRDIFARYGLTRIINASGTETVKGASPVCSEVLEAVNSLAPHSVDMLELQSVACHAIADAFESEAGLVVHCTAAGISISMAACMTGEDLARVERLPDSAGMKNEVILQRGHNVNYGASIAQNITIAGAKVIEIGAATECGAYQLASAITPQTAAAFYVVSHHTVQSGLIDLETFCRLCRRQRVPVIVDAAAEPEPRLFLRAGADLVITSMHKQFASLTAATIAGRLDLVRACLLQERGIGRTMKVGKEAVIGAIAALERWSALDHEAIAAVLAVRLARGAERLAGLAGVVVSLELDATSKMFSRLLLNVDPAIAGFDASELAAALAVGDPSIFVRSLMADIGLLQIDLRRASDGVADLVFGRIESAVTALRKSRAGGTRDRPPVNPADQALEKLRAFPLPTRKKG